MGWGGVRSHPRKCCGHLTFHVATKNVELDVDSVLIDHGYVWHAQVKAHTMVDTFSQILQCGWVMPSTFYGIRLKTMNYMVLQGPFLKICYLEDDHEHSLK
jgi:hypothetical protein